MPGQWTPPRPSSELECCQSSWEDVLQERAVVLEHLAELVMRLLLQSAPSQCHRFHLVSSCWPRPSMNLHRGWHSAQGWLIGRGLVALQRVSCSAPALAALEPWLCCLALWAEGAGCPEISIQRPEVWELRWPLPWQLSCSLEGASDQQVYQAERPPHDQLIHWQSLSSHPLSKSGQTLDGMATQAAPTLAMMAEKCLLLDWTRLRAIVRLDACVEPPPAARDAPQPGVAAQRCLRGQQ